MEPHKEEAKARYGLQRHIRRILYSGSPSLVICIRSKTKSGTMNEVWKQ
jgi:hypothetical protein